MRPGAKGTSTSTPALAAACSMAAAPPRTTRSASETRLSPDCAPLKSPRIPSRASSTRASSAGSFTAQSLCGARRTRPPLAPPRMSVPRNVDAEAQAALTSSAVDNPESRTAAFSAAASCASIRAWSTTHAAGGAGRPVSSSGVVLQPPAGLDPTHPFHGISPSSARARPRGRPQGSKIHGRDLPPTHDVVARVGVGHHEVRAPSGLELRCFGQRRRPCRPGCAHPARRVTEGGLGSARCGVGSGEATLLGAQRGHGVGSSRPAGREPRAGHRRRQQEAAAAAKLAGSVGAVS